MGHARSSPRPAVCPSSPFDVSFDVFSLNLRLVSGRSNRTIRHTSPDIAHGACSKLLVSLILVMRLEAMPRSVEDPTPDRFVLAEASHGPLSEMHLEGGRGRVNVDSPSSLHKPIMRMRSPTTGSCLRVAMRPTAWAVPTLTVCSAEGAEAVLFGNGPEDASLSEAEACC